ncbi:MAG TPA: membrane protein insertase YidC [Steroidobacteraceae bacterium]|nr:membrane protein insertase YidC [Steroidobacteraceae bacterium]
MPSTRALLWVALGLILFINYETWMRDYGSLGLSGPAAPAGVNAPAPTNPLGESLPKPPSPPPAAGTETSPPAAPTLSGAVPSPPGAAASPPTTPGEAAPTVHVVTDVLDIEISLKGGEIDRADLRQYPLHKDTPGIPVRLENPESGSLYELQTGLVGGSGEEAPTHLATWTSPASAYVLPAAAKELRVPLEWSDGHGLSVTKTFVFTRGWYGIDLDYQVRNDSATARSLASYGQILRHWEHASRSYFDVETYSFKGPSVFDGTKTRDLKVESSADSHFAQIVTNGWLASLQHHFVSAIVPPADQPYNYALQVDSHEYLLSATGPFKQIAAGAAAQFREKLFIGPKLQSQLAVIGPRLERTADYGLLTVIAQPLFAGLRWVDGITGNWGWAIIIVTAIIKLIFYPLSQASGRSMAKMRAVAPRMKQIQETFKDDREKLGRAMMELYKKEKINPLAGCLPMIVQIPFFISFYWVLLESVEMRQAPFLLWINDLSAHDPYFVLPLLMGASMFAQFKLNPAPPDPMQAKIMQFMPLVMTGMMAWFPSGLVLYWLTNTVLSIAQQWRINQITQAEARPRS